MPEVNKIETNSLYHPVVTFEVGEGDAKVIRQRTEAGEVVGILIYDKANNKICIVEQPRAGVDFLQFLEIPAGKIDDNETASDAIIREMAEEVGLKPNVLKELGTYYVSPGWTNEGITLAFCDDYVEVPRPAADDTDEIKIHWVDVVEFFEHCSDLKSAAAIGFAKMLGYMPVKIP